MGDIMARAFEFNPPSMIRWYTLEKDQVGVMFIQNAAMAPQTRLRFALVGQMSTVWI